MRRILRGLAAVAAASTLLGYGLAPAEASPAAARVTIGARSPFPKVSGDTWVAFGSQLRFDTARLGGTIAGGAKGEVATLLGERFRASRFTPVDRPIVLTSSAARRYQFTVHPTLATRYVVRVTNGRHVVATSPAQVVYVSATATFAAATTSCSATVCTYRVRAYLHFPSSAFTTEARKHFYLYLAVGRSHTKPKPTIPPYFTRAAGRASALHRVRANDFVTTLTYLVGYDGYNYIRWHQAFCTKDNEARDGLGLPGHHGCGARRFKDSVAYLG
jgi:hypothetical protein